MSIEGRIEEAVDPQGRLCVWMHLSMESLMKVNLLEQTECFWVDGSQEKYLAYHSNLDDRL